MMVFIGGWGMKFDFLGIFLQIFGSLNGKND
jgi:hypothetical protein